SGKIHDSRGVAVAPLHANLFAVGQHSVSSSPRGVYRIAAEARNPFFLHALTIYTLPMQLLDGFFPSPPLDPFFTTLPAHQSIPDFEAAPARARVRAGIIPQAAAAAISACCRAELFDLAALAQAVSSAGNLAIPLVKQLTALVARTSPDAARFVHYGAT